jgi:hypothetical protein
LTGAGRPVFVGGSSRSGTTLLGAMLGVGSDKLTVPEAEFKWQMWAAGIVTAGESPDGAEPLDGVVDMTAARAYLERDRMFQLWQVPLPHDAPQRVSYGSLLDYLVASFGRDSAQTGTDIWVDHTPGNIRFALTLRRAFPDARFVNIVRDGRAVAASVLPLDWGPNSAVEAGWHWATQVAAGLAAQARLGPDVVHTVRYEDLVRDPEPVLHRICAFAGVAYDDRMVHSRDYTVHAFEADQQALVAHPPDPSRVDAWRQQLTPGQIRDFERVTGELLGYLGYEPVFGPRAGRPAKGEKLRVAAHSTVRRLVVNKLKFRRRRARGGAGG